MRPVGPRPLSPVNTELETKLLRLLCSTPTFSSLEAGTAPLLRQLKMSQALPRVPWGETVASGEPSI